MPQVTEKPRRRFENLMERLNAPLPGKAVASDPYAKRLPAFRPDASAQTARTTAPAKPMAAALVAPTVTPEEAAQAAISASKARHAKVMASSAVRGRERQAGELLMASCKAGSKYASADVIIAELTTLPLDVQLEAVEKHLEVKAIDAVWARARAVVETNALTHGTNAKSSERDIDAMWARAWERISA